MNRQYPIGKILLVISCAVLLCSGGGCHKAASQSPKGNTDKFKTGLPESMGTTIGSLCELVGYESVTVMGQSLVVGLANTGSEECPPYVRQYLKGYLRKLKANNFLPEAYMKMTADQIINSPTTSIVQVRGVVPAGAPKGSRFDVQVYIPWSTQTTSLQGGQLIPTELRIVVSGQGGQPLVGHATALAGGPIFINPAELSSAHDVKNVDTDVRVLQGVVLGGGISRYDRKIQLALLEPDSRVAQQIQRRINSRFQKVGADKVADATRYAVTIKIPKEYLFQYEHFVKVLLSLFLDDSQAAQQERIHILNDLLQQGRIDYETAAIAWEAIGKRSLDYLQQIYEKGQGKLEFYAARSALNLEDYRAVSALIRIARDDNHSCQKQAIEILTHLPDDIRVLRCLQVLVNHKDINIRILAYNGLRQIKNGGVQSLLLPGKFVFDFVNSRGEKIVCAWADAEPRIVLFGKDIKCPRNMFFESQDGTLLINSLPGESQITITCKKPGYEQYLTRHCSHSLDDLITTMALPVRGKKDNSKTGLNISFSRIVAVLRQLCRQKIITARFVFVANRKDLLKEPDNKKTAVKSPSTAPKQGNRPEKK